MIEFEEATPRRSFETAIPLINVVFLLLIFFLLVGTLGPTDPVNVTLPAGRLDDKQSRQPLTFYIEADGFVWLDDKVMDPQLAPYLLRDQIKEAGTDQVAVKADKETPADALLLLMEGLRNVGVKQVTILTERKE